MQGDLFANFTGNEPGEAKNSNLATLETLNCDYQLIDTEEKREEIIQKLLTSKILSLDTENYRNRTNGRRIGRNEFFDCRK